jgi:glucosylceramidase
MQKLSSRREFVKSSAFAALAAATPFAQGSTQTPKNTKGNGTVSAWITDDQRRLAKQQLAWTSAIDAAKPTSIVINPAKSFQPILGFGAAFTDAACYTFNRLDPSAREVLFHELFHPSEMGLSVCRTCIGSSDYSTEVFSYDEGDPDPELKRFSKTIGRSVKRCRLTLIN